MFMPSDIVQVIVGCIVLLLDDEVCRCISWAQKEISGYKRIRAFSHLTTLPRGFLTYTTG